MFIFDEGRYFPSCHASTLVEVAPGQIVAAWFAGSKEGADNVAIWSSILEDGNWSTPRVIADHDNEPLWNPVLFQHDEQTILTYRVAKRIPEWRSCIKRSNDSGHTWSEPEPLPSGFLGPIKNKPVRMSNGIWLCGSSVETGKRWYARMEHFDAANDNWIGGTDLHLPGDQGIIQPAVWEADPGHVHALIRSNTGHIVRTDSQDYGQTWSEPHLTATPNNNSGLDVVQLDSGQLVLCCNPVGRDWGKRTPLVLLLSADNGDSWQHEYVLEDEDGEFSYPAVIQTGSAVTVTYTHQRTRISCRTVPIADLQNAPPPTYKS